MKLKLEVCMITIFLIFSIIHYAMCENKIEKIGTMETILGKIEIYAVWTEDLVNPQAAAGITITSKNIVILVRPEYLDSLLTGVKKGLEKVKKVYSGPELSNEERTISKVPIKFIKNYEAHIKWAPRVEENSKGVVYINFLHEGNEKPNKESATLMMYPDQAEAFIKAMKKALEIAESKAAASKKL